MRRLLSKPFTYIIQNITSTPLKLGRRATGLDTSKLVKLDEAARRLGCHVETLRLRVRTGRLKAVRGPHGAYYVSQTALRSLHAIRRARPPVEVQPEAVRQSWNLIARRLGRWSLAPLRALYREPDRNLPLYRLVSVHCLAALGVNFGQIAGELGISARHARRLHRKELADELDRWWRPDQAGRLGARRARREVAGLRARLEAAGVQRHQIARMVPNRGPTPTTAFTVNRLDERQITWLRTLGLREQEIQAIIEVGIGTDELNALLLKAIS
jgi:hypothetical protein